MLSAIYGWATITIYKIFFLTKFCFLKKGGGGWIGGEEVLSE